MYESALGQQLSNLLFKHCDGFAGACPYTIGERYLKESSHRAFLVDGDFIERAANCYYSNSNKPYEDWKQGGILIHYINFAKLLSNAGIYWRNYLNYYRNDEGHYFSLKTENPIYGGFFSHLTNNLSIVPVMATFTDDDIVACDFIYKHSPILGSSPSRRFNLLDESSISKWQADSFRALAYASYKLIYVTIYAVYKFSYLAASKAKDLESSCATLQCLCDEHAAEANAHYYRLSYAEDFAQLGQEIKFTLGAIVDTVKYCFPPRAAGSHSTSYFRELPDGELDEIIDHRFFSPLILRLRAASASADGAAA